jgi:spore coat protein H
VRKQPFVAIGLSIALAAGLLFAAAAPPANKTPARKPTTKEIQHSKEMALADSFFNNTKLSRITLDVEPKALQGLNAAPKVNVHATVKAIIPGQREVTYKDVAMHLKGSAGSFRKVEDKPAMTLNFDKFVEDQHFQGLDKVLLNNSVQDPTFMHENLCGAILRAAGGYAARASIAQVILNGRDLGPFVVKEGFNKPYYRKFFPDDDGNLYEGKFTEIHADMPIHYGKRRKLPAEADGIAAKQKYDEKVKSDQTKARAKMKELLDACAEKDAVARREKLERVLDVDGFYTFMAFEAMTAHWDGYCGNRNNYRIYHNLVTDRLVFIAHGMDQMFQRADYPLIDNNKALVCQALLATSRDRQRYFERVADLRKKWLTPEKLIGEVDRLAVRIAPLMQELGPNYVQQHKQQTQGLKDRILQRLANIDQQLAAAPRPLKFDAGGTLALVDQKWDPITESGKATLDRVTQERKPILRIKLDAPGGAASWRTTISLPAGKYTLEGQLRTANVIPPDGTAVKGPNDPAAPAGATLLILGATTPITRQIGFSRYTPIKREFDVPSTEPEITLSCDLTAKSGEAFFDLTTLKIRKRP